VPVSVLAGKQVEHLIGIFQEPVRGDWWIFYKDDLLGYYPADMFTMLDGGACGSAYYGEAARRKPLTPKTWPKTEVGSGQHGSAGPLLAAYVRKPLYVDPVYWYPVDVQQGTASLPPTTPAACYTREPLKDGYVFFGGPGGYDPNCTGVSP
jgi:hypothetical protein